MPFPFLPAFLYVAPPPLLQVSLCQDCIEWAKKENRMFLRQALQARLVALYVDLEEYSKGLEIATALLRELKKIDDKALLVEVCQGMCLGVSGQTQHLAIL